ncbi:MAG TPA: PhnD/SsuA/transferrin family substrate-binding protein [Symbiobacteriaceae bacterium]|nr:PhnD/SsuA/transferrin family substrate-binding protein [Symbiobacteriaceae bacterium]
MRRAPWLLLILTLSLLLAGCSAAPPGLVIRLKDLDPTLAAGDPGISPRPVLRVGVSPMLSPREMLLRYGPLMDYLGRRLGRRVELVLPRSHTETFEMVRSGAVQVAVVSGYAYVLGQKEFGMEALAVPTYDGLPTRRAHVLVRRYSGIIQFSDLKGHTFAYTDPLSASGRLYPEAKVLDLSEPLDRFFERTTFVASDDKALKALDQGLVDGCAVDSAMYDYAVLADPDLARRLRIIDTSEPLGAPPVVVSPRMGSELKRALQEALLDLDQDDVGRSVLSRLQTERYVKPDSAWYESIRTLAAQVGARQ